MIIIGIDPGKTGAIAIYNGPGDIEIYTMPDTEQDMNEFFRDLKYRSTMENIPMMAYIEKVNPFPGQGVVSVWTFARSYDVVRMAMKCNNIAFDTVPPKQWQKKIGLVYPKGTKSPQKKKLGRAKAQEHFPDMKFKLAEADSLLIMRYGVLTELPNQ